MKNPIVWIVVAALAVYAFFMWRKDKENSEEKTATDKAFDILSQVGNVKIRSIDGKPAPNAGILGGSNVSLGPNGELIASLTPEQQVNLGVVGITKPANMQAVISNFTSGAATPNAGLLKQYGNCQCRNGSLCVGQGDCSCCDKQTTQFIPKGFANRKPHCHMVVMNSPLGHMYAIPGVNCRLTGSMV